MVVCRYFQQGTCRYGQYCRFQHINNFGANQGNTNKQFAEGSKNIVLGVAEEVLAAERGGQWLLSCFGPLKEQPCIPGMDDVSPEEVRWEMYQAQKNGTSDQTKLQFQQLCQAMTAKREALKNPTHETAAMLDKLQKGNRDGAFGGKTNFALSTPQMSQPSNSTTTFGASSNPFGFNASGATTASTASSIFGRATATTSGASVFGAKPAFGGNAMFGGAAPTVFGAAASNTTSAVFGGSQNMQSFATAAAATAPPATNSVFGGGNFGATQPSSSPFSMAQPAQPAASVFGTTSTIFGAAQPATPAIGSTSIFGGAPVFGGTAGGFGAASTASVFGGSTSFENPRMPASTVFGGNTGQSATFGANAQANNTSFGAVAVTQTSTPFGAVSAANATPFGATSGPFGSAPAAANSSPFARAATFAGAMQTPGNEESSPFAAGAGGFGALQTVSQPFGAPPGFGAAPSTPFASTTSTTTANNPFAPRSQSQVNSPFGVAQTVSSSGGPFGQSTFGSVASATILDEALYTYEGQLTDDEKSSYMAEKFTFGKIPRDPPTIELR